MASRQESDEKTAEVLRLEDGTDEMHLRAMRT